MHRDRQADRPDDSTECAGESGSSHKMTGSMELRAESQKTREN